MTERTEREPSSAPKVRVAPSSPTLRRLRMRGPYPLAADAVERAVARRSPGNFALGYLEDGTFRVFLLGRADANLRQALLSWVDRPSRPGRLTSPAKAAWGSRRRRGLPLGAPAFGAVDSTDTPYTCFAFSYSRSADAALEKQRTHYAAFGGHAALDDWPSPGAPGDSSHRLDWSLA